MTEERYAWFQVNQSRSSNGAYWEAGYAEGLGKPVIYLCKRSAFGKGDTHFDTNHHLTVQWDLETMADDMERLKATIRFSIPEARQID
jgi:nucleoside 2-deoxyribosyltransferase